MSTHNTLLSYVTRATLLLALFFTLSCSKSDDAEDVPGIDGGVPGVGVGAPATDLSLLTEDYTAHDGEVLTGTLSNNIKIMIDSSATVTLAGVIINGAPNQIYKWAGITCLGDATLILADSTVNIVKGFHGFYPGIQPGPKGTTLTICGTGALSASSNGRAPGIGSCSIDDGEFICGNICIEGGTITAEGGNGAAGIGSARVMDGISQCGDITITGGTVTAIGGGNGAGIGSGYVMNGVSQCGDITIMGGTVMAKGGEKGAGIGCGFGYGGTTQCGNITINGGNDFVSVTAIKGGSGVNKPIGLSSTNLRNNTCGIITFNNTKVFDGNDVTYSYTSNGMKFGGLTLTISSSDPEDNKKKDDTWTLKP